MTTTDLCTFNSTSSCQDVTDGPHHWLITCRTKVNCDLVNFIFSGRPNVWRMSQLGGRWGTPLRVYPSSINTTSRAIWIIPESLSFIKVKMENQWHLCFFHFHLANTCAPCIFVAKIKLWPVLSPQHKAWTAFRGILRMWLVIKRWLNVWPDCSANISKLRVICGKTILEKQSNNKRAVSEYLTSTLMQPSPYFMSLPLHPPFWVCILRLHILHLQQISEDLRI